MYQASCSLSQGSTYPVLVTSGAKALSSQPSTPRTENKVMEPNHYYAETYLAGPWVSHVSSRAHLMPLQTSALIPFQGGVASTIMLAECLLREDTWAGPEV